MRVPIFMLKGLQSLYKTKSDLAQEDYQNKLKQLELKNALANQEYERNYKNALLGIKNDASQAKAEKKTYLGSKFDFINAAISKGYQPSDSDVIKFFDAPNVPSDMMAEYLRNYIKGFDFITKEQIDEARKNYVTPEKLQGAANPTAMPMANPTEVNAPIEPQPTASATTPNIQPSTNNEIFVPKDATQPLKSTPQVGGKGLSPVIERNMSIKYAGLAMDATPEEIFNYINVNFPIPANATMAKREELMNKYYTDISNDLAKESEAFTKKQDEAKKEAARPQKVKAEAYASTQGRNEANAGIRAQEEALKQKNARRTSLDTLKTKAASNVETRKAEPLYRLADDIKPTFNGKTEKEIVADYYRYEYMKKASPKDYKIYYNAAYEKKLKGYYKIISSKYAKDVKSYNERSVKNAYKDKSGGKFDALKEIMNKETDNTLDEAEKKSKNKTQSKKKAQEKKKNGK